MYVVLVIIGGILSTGCSNSSSGLIVNTLLFSGERSDSVVQRGIEDMMVAYDDVLSMVASCSRDEE